MSSSKLYSYYIALILLLVGLNLQAQPNKTQFEQERKRLLEHIRSIKKILSQTESKQKVTTGQLTAINKQIENNHLLAQSLNQELDAINKQLAQQLHQIAHLEKELAQLKKEYASMAYLGAKTMHDIHLLAFIFSAASFQELLQRLSAIKQYTRLRQKHFQEIQHVRLALQAQQKSLEQQGVGKNALLQKWRKEQTKLTNLKQQQTKIIATLEQRHTQLLKELHQRNDAVKRLDHLITDLVKRETAIAQQQKQETTTISKVPSKKLLTPAMAALTAAFTQHRGKLPWPVKTGFISSKFGIQPHAVLQNIQVENLGIDI
jgi:murein hydrolase activator